MTLLSLVELVAMSVVGWDPLARRGNNSGVCSGEDLGEANGSAEASSKEIVGGIAWRSTLERLGS